MYKSMVAVANIFHIRHICMVDFIGASIAVEGSNIAVGVETRKGWHPFLHVGR